jgi:hypothetical protein
MLMPAPCSVSYTYSPNNLPLAKQSEYFAKVQVVMNVSVQEGMCKQVKQINTPSYATRDTVHAVVTVKVHALVEGGSLQDMGGCLA